MVKATQCNRRTERKTRSWRSSPCSGHSQEVGQVHKASLSRPHPRQPWSHVLLPFLYLLWSHLWILKGRACVIIRKLLLHKLGLVHVIAIDWSINKRTKVWSTVIRCFCLWLCVISEVFVELFCVVYFLPTSDQPLAFFLSFFLLLPFFFFFFFTCVYEQILTNVYNLTASMTPSVPNTLEQPL